jgi:hypothetical protein
LIPIVDGYRQAGAGDERPDEQLHFGMTAQKGESSEGGLATTRGISEVTRGSNQT